MGLDPIADGEGTGNKPLPDAVKIGKSIVKAEDAALLIELAGGGLAVLAWGIIVKYKDYILRLVALSMPAKASEDQLKA